MTHTPFLKPGCRACQNVNAAGNSKTQHHTGCWLLMLLQNRPGQEFCSQRMIKAHSLDVLLQNDEQVTRATGRAAAAAAARGSALQR